MAFPPFLSLPFTPSCRDHLSIKLPTLKSCFCLRRDPNQGNDKRGYTLSRRSRHLFPCGRWFHSNLRPHTRHITPTPIYTCVHMQIHRLTYAHTDTHRYIKKSHTYVRLPVIASDQVSLSPPKGIKKDHVSIKAMSPKAGLFFWAYPAVF